MHGIYRNLRMTPIQCGKDTGYSKLHHFEKDEFSQILMWLLIRKYYPLYQHYIDSKQNVPASDEMINYVVNIIKNTKKYVKDCFKRFLNDEETNKVLENHSYGDQSIYTKFKRWCRQININFDKIGLNKHVLNDYIEEFIENY
jgi:hypothetical protein